MAERIRNQVEYHVWGKNALFSDPLVRIGGEKASYPIPTYEALLGVTKSVYFKPTILWVIDEVRVLNEIKFESRGTRPINYNDGSKPNLSYATYLRDVSYIVKAHFVMNKFHPELAQDWNENKHFQIMKRAIAAGGRQDIFLGTRECQAYVEPVEKRLVGYYDDVKIKMPFGVMFSGFDYPDTTGDNFVSARFWDAEMIQGVVNFPKPADCPIIRKNIRPMTAKVFGKNNYSIETE